jgi:hypothetical protein
MTGDLFRDRATKGMALAPSQHIRPQHTRRPHNRTAGNRRGAASIVLLLGASMLLSACEPKQSDTAAVVNDTVITENDVQTVSRQLSTLTKGQPFTASNALFGLILAPFVTAEGNRQKKSIPDEQVLQIIGKIPNPSVSTASFVKMQLLLQQLDPASQDVVGAALGKAKIVVNPRYGTYNPKLGLVQCSPNWLKLSTPAAAKCRG